MKIEPQDIIAVIGIALFCIAWGSIWIWGCGDIVTILEEYDSLSRKD